MTGAGIDARHARSETGRVAGRDSGTAADVDHGVAGRETAEPRGQLRVAVPTDAHAERGGEAGHAGEPGVVGVVIRNGSRVSHTETLTVEPDFKSSRNVPESLMTIGEVAERAHVATSTIRYYERRGLLAADARQSGQRRFREATLRRLVFIGMLQDAGLALDDIAGILDAEHVAEWKAIARRRLEVLDEEINRLNEAREYLAGALLCRYDHPATDCKVMGAEIDRRLAESADSVVGGPAVGTEGPTAGRARAVRSTRDRREVW